MEVAPGAGRHYRRSQLTWDCRNMTQAAQETELLRLEQSVARLEQLMSRRQERQARERDAYGALKQRHDMLRARAQAAIDGIDQILGEDR
jgi:hypothetical protein